MNGGRQETRWLLPFLAETDHTVQMREEVREAESDNKKLRDQLRGERDKYEQSMKDHADVMTEQLEQRQKIESAATRREEALHRRLFSAEKELDALRSSSVPDSKFRSLQQQLSQEKQTLMSQIEAAVTKAATLEGEKQSERQDFEKRIEASSAELVEAKNSIRQLQQAVRLLFAHMQDQECDVVSHSAATGRGYCRGSEATATENPRRIPDHVQLHGRTQARSSRRQRALIQGPLPSSDILHNAFAQIGEAALKVMEDCIRPSSNKADGGR